MGLLQDLFGGIESGNNPNIGITSGTIGGLFQQSLGFQNQYGGNTTGSTILDPAFQTTALNNYISAALSNNPSLTVGDLYAGYYLNTGTAGNPNLNFSMLPENVQANVINNASNYGVDLNAPASAYFGDAAAGTIPTGATSASEGYGSSIVGDIETALGTGVGTLFGGGSALPLEGFVGGSAAAAGATAAASGGGGGLGGLVGGLFGGGGGGSTTIGVTPGLATGIGDWVTSLGQSLVQGFDSATSGFLAGMTNWISRGFIILIALVLIGIALAGLIFRGAGQAPARAAAA
jgi:hypothetical protein